MDLLSQFRLGGTIRGEAGRTYRLISGAMRNSGAGWTWINDAGHAPSGLGSITSDGSKLTIGHTVGAGKVSSLQITPDEYYAARGLRCGASVGLDSSNIFLYTGNPFMIIDYVQYISGSGTWESQNGVFTGFSYNGAGILTLTHESMGTGPESHVLVTGRSTLVASPGNITDTTSQVVFYSGGFGGTTGAASTGTAHTHPGPGLTAAGAANNAMKAHVLRSGIRSVPPANPSSISSASGNLWVTGLLEI